MPGRQARKPCGNTPWWRRDTPTPGTIDYTSARRLSVTGSGAAEVGKHGYAMKVGARPHQTVWVPQSQSQRAMGGKRFQESKQAVLNWIAAQIGVDAEELRRAG